MNCLGRVILQKDHHLHRSAEQATNNTGELTAIGEALKWLEGEDPYPQVPVIIRYDSEYAAGMVSRKMTPKANKKLVEQTKAMYGRMAGRRAVSLEWVQGHSDENRNHCSDWLADRGENGRIEEHSKR